jgi:hypothetical protein
MKSSLRNELLARHKGITSFFYLRTSTQFAFKDFSDVPSIVFQISSFYQAFFQPAQFEISHKSFVSATI